MSKIYIFFKILKNQSQLCFLIQHKKSLKLIFSLFILLQCSIAFAQVSLKAIGDEQHGFHVDIYSGKQLMVTNNEEFSLQLFNLDMTTVADLKHWTGQKWIGNKDSITLTRDLYIEEFDANLSINVTYSLVNTAIVKKKIRLLQPSMPKMYYILKETARPATKPQSYVTFEHENFPGGFVHEMFPSAGFITPDNNVVGFLTEAGYKNQYSRNTRRRFSGRDGGFTGLRRLPDPQLYAVSNASERANDNNYISQTFGEMYNLDAGDTTLLKIDNAWQKKGNAEIEDKNGLLSIKGHKGDPAGIEFITPLKDQKVYTISFLYKGNAPLALKLFRVKQEKKTLELEDGMKYVDNISVSEKKWTSFKRSILVPYIEGDSVSMFLGTQSGNECKMLIKDLKFIEHHPQSEAYNVLPMGEEVEKTTYVFIEPWKSHQQFMISSQSRLAEAEGFKGSQIEKMLYANFNMLTWITDVDDFKPFNVPNMNYAPDMYNRDSFFSTASTYNEKLNLEIWEQWGKTQTRKGSIGTIITPLMGSVEAKDNEATIEWLIWAMLNKRRFGVKLPHDKIKRAVDYVLNEFDPDRSGICKTHFPMSQIDIIDYDPKTDRLAVDQGMLVVALKTIKELGFKISDGYIQKAENGYRDFYDDKRKHLIFDRNYPDLISLTDLEPEFFSLWLFKKPMLTDEMVKNELDKIPILNKVSNSPHPEYGTTAPILMRLTKDKKGYAYLNGDYQPFGKWGNENYSNGKADGFYYNGGSWFRPEYCAYVVGLKHGWKIAKPLMENRIWAEIYLNPKWPFSKEFIPTKWTSTDSWWQSTKGLCWNVFILMADEVAGLRTPDMDPDYKKK